MIRLAVAAVLAMLCAAPAIACQDSHRFETFSLAAPGLGHAKRLLVYLPPGYDCGDARYPVFYLNDGHDLFEWDPFAPASDPALSPEIAKELTARENWYGSWRLDQQLDRALATGALPAMIVVGIASDDGLRSRDLAPVPWDGSAEARGGVFVAFVADALVPVVDRAYRTLATRRCRGIGGASLGAVSALQVGLTYPQKFGMVMALSPVLHDLAIAGYVAALWPGADDGSPAVLIDLDDDPIGHADLAWLESMPPAPVSLIQRPGGRHRIASWAERVIPALQQLFDGQCEG